MRRQSFVAGLLGSLFLTCAVSCGISIGTQDKPQENVRQEKKIEKEPEQLRPESRQELVRFISSEFVTVVKSLPCEKKSILRVKAGERVKGAEKKEGIRVVDAGACQISPGDKVRITGLDLEKKDAIVIDINGGSKGPKKSLRQKIGEHVQIGMGGAGPQVHTTKTDPNGGPEQPPGFNGNGATIWLEFDKNQLVRGQLPDMTPDDLKRYLASVLDFAKDQRSASVQWIETLPPEFQKAVKEKRAILGMTAEMIEVAIGKPDKKIREEQENRDGSKMSIIDWQYDLARAPLILVVRFSSDDGEREKVVVYIRKPDGTIIE